MTKANGMGLIKQKLLENQNRRHREMFISSAPSQLSDFIKQTSFSSNVLKIHYARFYAWDNENKCKSNSRGSIAEWNYSDFPDWISLIQAIKRLKPFEDIKGNFFFHSDSPYYEMSLKTFLELIDNIAEYAEVFQKYDLMWVASENDSGISAEYDHNCYDENEFSLCIWNIEESKK